VYSPREAVGVEAKVQLRRLRLAVAAVLRVAMALRRVVVAAAPAAGRSNRSYSTGRSREDHRVARVNLTFRYNCV
jgi:hypothetical protein